MFEIGFFANLFFSNKQPILDPIAKRLKEKIEKALLSFQLATDIEIGEKIPPQIFNAIDLYNFEKNDLLKLQAFRDRLDVQKERQGMLVVARALLTSDDPILQYCVAVELSEELLKRPQAMDLKNKNLSQLREMAEKNSGRLIAEVSKQVEVELAKRSVLRK